MKSTTKLTLLLLMALIISLPSYTNTTLLEEPNLVKDFQVAGPTWYNSSWAYRRGIPITGSVGAGTNYQVIIAIAYASGKMQSDFDDLRFTDNDGVTLLDYWIESYVASGYALVWVEVKDNLDVDQIIGMYYGNSGVSSASNGFTTFPFFDDFNDGSLNASLWTEHGAGGSYVESSASLTVTGGAGAWETIGAAYDFGSNYSFGSRLYFSTENDRISWGCDDRAVTGSQIGSGIDDAKFKYVSGKYYSTRREGTAEDNARTSTLTNPTLLEIRTFATSTLFYEDRVLKQTNSVQVPTDDMGHYIAVYDNLRSCILDWVYTRKCIATEPDTATFGSEEAYSEYTPPQWKEAGEPVLYFHVPSDKWGLNAGLVLLGMILVPASGMYLVKGGKSEASVDKVFFALIAFFLGWGLIIGGII